MNLILNWYTGFETAGVQELIHEQQFGYKQLKFWFYLTMFTVIVSFMLGDIYSKTE